MRKVARRQHGNVVGWATPFASGERRAVPLVRYSLHFVCALALATSLPVRAQLGLPVETDLFGDDIVRKLDADGNDLRFAEANSEEGGGGKPKAKVTGFEHTLVFQDGRQLRGALGELTKSEVVWRRADASAPLRFARSEVRRLVLAATMDGRQGDHRFNNANMELYAQVATQQFVQGIGELMLEAVAQVVVGDPGRVVRQPNLIQLIMLKMTETMREMGLGGRGEMGRTVEKKADVPTATLKLPGGDWLFGEVASADGVKFTLKLADGNVLSIPRAPLEWLYFDDQAVPAYGFAGGVLDLESWPVRTADARLEVADGTLLLRDGWLLGRTLAPPKRFEVAFEVPEDAEEGLRLWIQPFGPQPNCYGTGTVVLRFGKKELQRCIYIRDMDRQTTALPPEVAAQKGPVGYRVFYDGQDKRLIVHRNGVQLGDWKFFPDEKKDKDAKEAPMNDAEREFHISGLCFDQEERGSSKAGLRFNRVRVQPWDGALAVTGAAAGAGDQLSTSGAAAVTGRLESIAGGELTFSGAKKKREPGTFVRLREAGASLADADAMLIFGQQGEVSVANLEIRDGRARGRTGFAAALDLPVGALKTVAFPARPVAAEKAGDALVFKNGNELRGTLLAADTSGGVRWKTTGGQEVQFQSARLAGVRFAAPSEPPKGGEPATVELRNGDRLRGEFAGLDEKQLHFQQAQLGTVQVARERLWSLYPNPRFPVVDGGRETALWTAPRVTKDPGAEFSVPGAWTVLDGSYILRGQRGSSNSGETPWLNAPLKEIPERFELRAEATDVNGNPPSFGVNLTSKDNRTALRASFNYYNLSLSMSNPKPKGQGRSSNYRNVMLRGKIPDPGSRLAVRIFVDRRAGTADIFLNGAPAARVGQQANERLPGFGELVSINAGQQDETTSILSGLWLGPWNGELPRTGDGVPAAVALSNGDAAPGTPVKAMDGKFFVETEAGPFELPMEKVQAVEFGGLMTPEKAPARLRLADGGVLSVEAFRWDGRELTAQSATLGELRLPAAAVSELIFNPAPVRPPRTPPTKALVQKTQAKPDAANQPAEIENVIDQ